jgi:tRNA A58 N-methylase Trm61
MFIVVSTPDQYPTFLQVARENFAMAGVADNVNVVVGPAAQSITKLATGYDLAFIDADSEANPHYFAEAKRLVRDGGVIVCPHEYIAYVSISEPFSRSWTMLSTTVVSRRKTPIRRMRASVKCSWLSARTRV